jgi:hypothetical protein
MKPMADRSPPPDFNQMAWKPASSAPREAWPLAVAVRITCSCGEGGIVVLSGARQNGEWVLDDFPHRFDIVEFFELPKPNCAKGH